MPLAPILRQAFFHAMHPRAERGHPNVYDSELARRIEHEFGAILADYPLSAEAFWRFKREECDYAEGYVAYMGKRLLNEKLLEHFVSVDLLRPAAGETWIDVGSAQSPFADWLARRRGTKAFQLDLAYEPGVRGSKIGAPADRIPLADGSVDAMTLHCTIEHFEGRGDSGFIREAARVLRPGGRICVLPVYFSPAPANVCDPARFTLRARFDPGAALHGAERYGNRFGRYYSPETFRDRILNSARDFSATLWRIKGEREQIPDNYLLYALTLERIPT